MSKKTKPQNFPQNFFIDLAETSAKKTASSLFIRIRDNFLTKPSHSNLKIQNNFSANQRSFSPRSTLLSIKSNTNKESRGPTPRDHKTRIRINGFKQIKQSLRDIKSYDFLGEREKVIDKTPLWSEKAPNSTLLTQTNPTNPQQRLTSNKSRRPFQSRSWARDDFLRTLNNCVEIRDKNSEILELLGNRDDEELTYSVLNATPIECEQLIQAKIKKIENIFNENFANSDHNQNPMLLDLLKLLYRESMKLLSLYSQFCVNWKCSGDSKRLNSEGKVGRKERNSEGMACRKDQNPEVLVVRKEQNPEGRTSRQSINVQREKSLNEGLEIINAVELLMKIHSPYNSENGIKLEAINEDYYCQYKTIFNGFLYDGRTQVFQRTLSRLEMTLKGFEGVVEELRSKFKSNEFELEQINEILRNNILIKKEETRDLFQKKGRTLSNAEEETKEKRSLMELAGQYNEIMLQNMKKVQAENDELQKQVNMLRRCSVFMEGGDPSTPPRRKPIKKPKTADKEVQITFQEVAKQEILPRSSPSSLSLILKQTILYYKYKDEDIVSLINLIFCEKFISDYTQIQESKRIRPLSTFLKDWFLIKMGSAELGEIMLSDFLLNVRDNVSKNSRFPLFLQLCGLDTGNVSDEISFYEGNGKKSGKREFKRIFLASSYACRIVLKTAYFLRYSPRVEDPDPYSSLFPGFNSEADLPKSKLLVPTLKDVLSDEGVTGNEAQEEIVRSLHKFSSKFKNSSPAAEPMNPRKTLAVIPTNTRRSSTVVPESGVKFDHFIKFVLDYFGDEFQQKMEHFSILLKLIENSRNQGRVFIEDFKAVCQRVFGNLPSSTLEILYLKFVQVYYEFQMRNFNEISLVLAKELLESVFYEEFYVKEEDENIRKNEKKEEKKFRFFARSESESPSESPFVYNLNNPENYKLWSMLDKNKHAFQINFYDIVDSLCFVTLIYDYVRETIKEHEGKNDALFTYHEIWKKEFYKLPMFQGLRNLKKYASMFMNWDRLDLIQKIQMNWNLIRLIGDAMMRKKEGV